MDYLSELSKQSREPRGEKLRVIGEGSDKPLVILDKVVPFDTAENEISDTKNTSLSTKERTVSRKRLVNKLNHCHFKGEAIQIQFKHHINGRTRSCNAFPQPCFGKYVVCLWECREQISKVVSPAYRFEQVEIIADEQVISVPATVRAVNEKGICLVIPEASREHTNRRMTRYKAIPLPVKLIQNGIIFSGTLRDFSASAFSVELFHDEATPINWINTRSRANLIVMSGDMPVYSGECWITKHNGDLKEHVVVLSPSQEGLQRFDPRVYRSKRVVLKPSPDIRFKHPITGSMVDLKVMDVSGSGLGVEDDTENAILIPGLVIPSLVVNFSNSFSFTCHAQVLYRRSIKGKNNKSYSKCGIAFLEVDPDDHVKLLAMLHNAENRNVYVCNHVDSDKLWEFFFETGFLYPKKYSFLQGCAKQVKQTYETLYSKQSDIARHFTWQKKGKILAHLAMLRFYEKTWLIHHLAARTSQHIGAGIDILKQVADFSLNTHRLVSSNMNYLMCYYRPEMRFPNRFFGETARNVKNPKACSLDNFAYMYFRTNFPENALPLPWRLEKPDHRDLLDFLNHYESTSGGLMLNALDLIPNAQMEERKELSYRYQRLGLIRERRLYVLKKHNCVKAVIMANVSDIALNLSDLTNCLSFFIVDGDGLLPEIFHKTLSIASKHYTRLKFPVLVNPVEYLQDHDIPFNRIYQLWALNMDYSDDYCKFYEELI